MNTSPVVNATPTRLLTTTSARSRGEAPYAVAFRKNVGLNRSSASLATSCSTSTFDRPYAVMGLKAAPSSSIFSAPAAPYRLQDEAKRKRGTPAALAASASRTLARWLISRVQVSLRQPRG